MLTVAHGLKKQMMPLIALFVISGTVGWLASSLRIPGGWLIGPLLASAIFSTNGIINVKFPRKCVFVVQSIIGVSLASTFTPTSLMALSHHWLPVLVLVLSMQVLTMLNALYFVRFNNLGPATALLGCLPGGAGEMAAISESLGGDARLVSVMQYSRLLVIIFFLSAGAWLIAHTTPSESASQVLHPAVVPPAALAPLGVAPDAIPPAIFANSQQSALSPVVLFLCPFLISAVGGLLGAKLRIPAGLMIVPLAISVWISTCGIPVHYPQVVLAVTYASLGIMIGTQFDRDVLSRMKSLMLPLLGTSCFLAIGSIFMGAIFARNIGLDWASAYLASTPGGLDSVAVVASELKADSAIILCVHFCRLLLVLISGPQLVQLFTRIMSKRL